jgi:chorismate-pyruvate lyase
MQSSSASPANPTGSAGRDRAFWSELVARHFVMQGRRPRDVREAAPGALDPTLRCLLFSDGLITRAVEALAVRRVTVRLVDQRPSATPAEAACFLPIAPGEISLRRRVIMSFDEPAAPIGPFTYAESHLVPRLLPAVFLRALPSAAGIGYALQQARVESRRELLWFGIRATPAWARSVVDRERVVRSYRIVIVGQPALYVIEGLPGSALSSLP